MNDGVVQEKNERLGSFREMKKQSFIKQTKKSDINCSNELEKNDLFERAIF